MVRARGSVQYKAFISYSHAADGRLAPAVQSALQRFAKPWYRLRALRAFRDQTSLAATPHLWGSIEEALGSSEFFLLLASPEAAASPWIAREVNWWLAHRDTATMLIGLTGGEVSWNQPAGDFDSTATTALPAALFGTFREEPLYVDLRWAREADQLSLRNTRFRAAILDLAATLHARPKDEMDGQDVREHRKTRRLAWSAATALALLTILAFATAAIAIAQRNLARSRELAASARTEMMVDPELSLILAQAAVERAATDQAQDALREALLKSNLRLTQRRHTRAVTAAMFSGEDAVSVSFDGQVLVWDANTGEVKYRLPGHRAAICGERIVLGDSSRAAVWSLVDGKEVLALSEQAGIIDDVAFSPDCQWIATAGRDKTARVYRASTGAPAGAFGEDRDILTKVSFSPDSRFLVTHRIYNRTEIWEVPSGRRVLSSPGYSAAFSPDMRMLVVPGVDNTGIRFWEVAGRRLAETSFAQPGSIGAVAYSPDGSLFVTTGTDGTARVWDAAKLRPVVVLSGHTDGVLAAEFSHDGRFIATASQDKTARVWVARSGEMVAELRGHTGPVHTAVFSADDRRVLTSSQDGTARIWSTGMTHPILVLTESGIPRLSQDPGLVRLFESASETGLVQGFRTVQQVAFSADGQLALVATDTDSTEVWRPGKAERLMQVPGTIASFSPDALRVVTGAEDGTIRMFRTVDGAWIRELGTHEGLVSGLAFSPDGRMIGSAGEDGSAQISNAATGAPIVRLSGHQDALSGLWFSPDSARVLTAGFDGSAILWQLPQGRASATWTHGKSVLSASFSADGRLAATAGEAGIAKIWDVASTSLVAELRGHEGEVSDIRFNARGDRLLTAGADGTARLWRLSGGTAEAEFVMRGHTQHLYKAVWSPDERFIATASQDYSIRLWEGTTGRLLTVLGTHTDAVYDIAFSPDGAYFMSGSEDGTAHIYACEVCVPVDRLLALAERRITREPTALEIRNFGLQQRQAEP